MWSDIEEATEASHKGRVLHIFCNVQWAGYDIQMSLKCSDWYQFVLLDNKVLQSRNICKCTFRESKVGYLNQWNI